ncbi:transcriptional regulator [Lactobacillus sp. PSON]|uniref:transcriptional regulator n=1 Tax=Lactobacillus sp. PSON TaxID=3455454 RepID=UPI0040437B29
MTSNKHDFEELTAPAAAAQELGISVATLRKYSLIVEKVTGNAEYYERTKQKSRLYTKKDIRDLDDFHKLSKNNGLTLQDAARQIFAVSEKKVTDKKRVEKEVKEEIPTDVMDTQEVVRLLNTLQRTIANQNKAIDDLQQQLLRIEKQNKDLIEAQKQLEAPSKEEVKALPNVEDNSEKNLIEEQNQATSDSVEAESEEKENSHEILAKAKENAKKRATANVHRTLEDMQVPVAKKHWWQRFLNL